ncbi:MAG: thioredoxin family protein [Candidatus Marinimicrobia bacterium]|nr:thioredoxin family protein [Candidatus Neomarinimicrobiota bacterium]MDD9888682.1 thioredoxin family protein [Candidatus Neomarinimicrobiota bacterium]MDD9931601.1 thioredoxin family protein [Candidatus Neomarinimicrobiota bacterium]
MHKYLFISMTCLMVSGCANPKTSPQYIFEDHYHYGQLNQELLMTHEAHPWFKKNYDAYSPNLSQLTSLNLNDISVRIFMGTWCHDSKREVPRFYKVWDGLKLSESQIIIVGLNKKKKGYFKNYSEFGITNTPTFIFYRNGKEIGRIVERPKGRLEEHLKTILSVTS